MKVIKLNANHIPALEPAAAAIGFFDGFHQGHRRLIDKTLEVAKENHLQSAIITFDPDPWEVFRPYENKDHLISLVDKASLAASLGIDIMYVLHFDQSFANRTIESFHQILENMQIQKLICGYDFTYSKSGLGNPSTLKKAGAFDVFVIDEVEDTNEKISTTRIEKLIRAGLVGKAGILLGYFYSIPGVIVHGYRRGTDLFNMPTANMQAEDGYVMPANGVYAGYVYDGVDLYPAMINIGSNPTFANAKNSIEAHIFDYDKDLYGRMVRFFFSDRLRPEERFASIEDLKHQLNRDAQRSRELLAGHKELLAATMDLWKEPDQFHVDDAPVIEKAGKTFPAYA